MMFSLSTSINQDTLDHEQDWSLYIFLILAYIHMTVSRTKHLSLTNQGKIILKLGIF